MDSHRPKVILIVIVAALAALYLGIAAATAQFEAIAWIAGALGLVICLAMGRHIWAIIPMAVVLSGTINALPGSPAPWWAAMAIAAIMYTLRFCMRRTETFQIRLNWLDFAIFLQVVAVGQAFLRNPTGLSVLGGAVAGGKPYIIFGFAVAAYALMSVTRTDITVVKRVALGMICVAIADGMLGVASQLIPAIAMVTLPVYSGVNFAATRGVQFEAESSRLDSAKQIGTTLGTAACSLFPPIHTLIPFRIIPFALMMASCAAILLSGFRSAMGWLLIVFVVGSLIRKRYLDVVISGTAGLLAVLLLLGTGLSRQLPYGAQRILSVIPFMDVEDSIRVDAKKSTEWRVEMWQLALGTDRYINNKWLGDGFNYNAAELQAAQDASFGDRRRAGSMSMQEMMLARGSYHGFHVEAIRFTGALGLACALIAMGIWFRYAIKLIRHFRGRPEWGYVIFICMPFLIHPFYYMLIFGAYRSGFTSLIVTSGILKILDNIRVHELAATRIKSTMPESSPSQVRTLTSGIPQSALRTR